MNFREVSQKIRQEEWGIGPDDPCWIEEKQDNGCFAVPWPLDDEASETLRCIPFSYDPEWGLEKFDREPVRWTDRGQVVLPDGIDVDYVVYTWQ